ncbi:MAG: CHRD domain-containing protein [Candidatus Limnocylindria bacterium]
MAAALLASAVFAARPNESLHFVTSLSGAEEVPPNSSLASGVAIFHLSADGMSLSYKLIASNIENVTQAHIHAPAPAGANAGVVAWLYPEEGQAPILIPGRHDGVLATGTITADDLVGSLAGQPLSALIAQIQSGNAYVNVHTTQFPGGEIRGQLD